VDKRKPTLQGSLPTDPEWDCEENYIDIDGACECWHDGRVDDLDHPFDEDRNAEFIKMLTD